MSGSSVQEHFLDTSVMRSLLLATWGGDMHPVALTMYRLAQIMIEKDRSSIVNKTYL
jgi:hypothetical protein